MNPALVFISLAVVMMAVVLLVLSIALWRGSQQGARLAAHQVDAINDPAKANAEVYIKVNAFDNTRGVESMVMSFIVQRPKHEPGFGLQRTEEHGRVIRYTTVSYATNKPAGERY